MRHDVRDVMYIVSCPVWHVIRLLPSWGLPVMSDLIVGLGL